MFVKLFPFQFKKHTSREMPTVIRNFPAVHSCVLAAGCLRVCACV